MDDLSTKDACQRAAAANADYHGICWTTSFPDTKTSGYPFWSGLTDAHRLSATRAALVTIYTYLHFRSEKDAAIELERMLFLEEIEPEWRPVLAKALCITVSDLSPRKRRHAFGADLSNPSNDLLAFAWDQQTSSSLLIEGYRREEIRRLEYKAFRMKSGTFDDRAKQSDTSWAHRNAEIFDVACGRMALAEEARLLVEPRP